MDEQTFESEIRSPAFQLTELRSECTRVAALLSVLGSLLLVVLIRGGMALAHGRHGEAWPFAALLTITIVYEIAWLRVVRRTIEATGTVSRTGWTITILAESLLPTLAIVLETHTSIVGPHRALTSPVVLTYLVFVILSTLHLDPGLSRLTGIFAAGGYATAFIYLLLVFPESVAEESVFIYGAAFSSMAFLLLGGYAASKVSDQIRRYVIAALHEAESRAKIAALKHDLEIARSIQQGLLPKEPPKVDGFEIAGWNQPADETGGDYYDWQQVADGRVAVAIADVTGHGIGSAIGMAVCRAYARAGLATDPNLPSLLNRLNTLLYEDLPSEKFVTLAAGVLNPEEATLQLISAGHGPLLFYSAANDCVRTYDAQGLPLGLLPQFSYVCPQVLNFAHGDMLVVVTDGLVEWANQRDEDFGPDRLKEVIRRYHDMPAARIISELYSAVVQFAGPMPQADDLTALIVKRL